MYGEGCRLCPAGRVGDKEVMPCGRRVGFVNKDESALEQDFAAKPRDNSHARCFCNDLTTRYNDNLFHTVLRHNNYARPNLAMIAFVYSVVEAVPPRSPVTNLPSAMVYKNDKRSFYIHKHNVPKAQLFRFWQRAQSSSCVCRKVISNVKQTK